MIYTKNKINNNIQNLKKNYIYEKSLKKNTSISYRETNNFTKISDIYKCIYEDFFPKILSFRTKELFINEIEKKALIILQNNFSNSELNTSFIKISIKKIKEEILNKLNKDYLYLKESLINIKKNHKKINYVSHYRKHCCKTEDLACHLCDNGQYGKFIEIKSKFYLKKSDISYVICDKCNFCYEKNFIKMYCKSCGKNYYSEILKENENVNCLPATWENYHCGSRIKEIMKCLKCKHILYIILNKNKLICLNKNCNFCIRPENIIWQCYFCNTEFKSGAKIYNPLEYENVKKTICRAILYKNKAVPPFLLCCNGEITDKTKFYHKKDCKGELYRGYLNNKEIVVCEKCHALNNFNKFRWLCPLCGFNFRLNDKIKYHKYNINYDAYLDILNNNSFSENKNKRNNLSKNNNKSIDESKPDSISKKNSKNKYNYNSSNNKYNIRNNNSQVNVIKPGDNISTSLMNNYFNFGYHKKNKTKDISYVIKKGISRNKHNFKSEDFSLHNNQNKSAINIRKQTYENSNNISKVSKSTKQKDKYRTSSKLKKRKRETLYEILNKRKNTPNFASKDKKNNKSQEIYYIKENNKEDEYKKNWTNIGFYVNNKKTYRNSFVDKDFKDKINLTTFNSKEKIIKNNKINRNNYNNIKIRKKLFISEYEEKDEKENNKKIIEQKKFTNFNGYINGFKKNEIISNSNDINYSNKNSRHQRNDNKNKKKNNLSVSSSKKELKSFENKHYKNSLSNIILKNYLSSNLITPIDNEEKEKEENLILKQKNHHTKFNKTDEHCKSKDYSIKKERINHEKIIFSDKVNKNKRIVIKQIKSRGSYDNIIRNIQKIETKDLKYKKSRFKIPTNVKFNHKKNEDFVKKDKDNIKIKDNDNDENIKKEKEEKKDEYKSIINEIAIDNNLMDVISEDKIDNLSKNCPIPSFEEDDYIYLKPIGEGSFGRIFLVQDQKSGEQYALKKVICKDYQELIKFEKEFELIYSLHNNNIMKIYKLLIKSLDITTSCLYVLMEKGQSDWIHEIKHRASTKNFYSENEIISILKQITSGLNFLQKKKIAHRDIKPQNILIFPGNVFKIADLGEAKNSAKNKIQMATLRGSELFMSPLLYNGLKYNKKNIRHNPFKSDVFSLGYCFLFAMCLNIGVLEDIREINDMENIKNIINKFVDRNRYTDKLFEIIYGMIDLEEDKRFDFEQLEKELKSKFN